METVEYTLLSHVHGKMDIRSLSHGMGKHQICNCAYTRARYSCKKASVVNAITEPDMGSNIINRKNTIIIYSRIFRPFEGWGLRPSSRKLDYTKKIRNSFLSGK